MPKLSTLSLSLGAAFALAPAASAPLAAQDVPACTGPQAVELRSIDLATGTGRSATLRGTGAYAHCSWATDSSGGLNVQLPLAALPTLDGSSAETCSLPIVSAPTEVTADPVIVEVLLVDPTPAVEGLLVWRGTVRSAASRVPSWSERVCAEARRGQSATQAASTAALPEVGWGIPGLDEIEALVRASSEVQTLLAEGAPPPESATEALPDIVREAGIPVRQGARIILLDSSETAADPTRHVHLIVREATPTAVQVAVDTGEGGQIELRWVRSVETPDWTLARGI